MPPISDDESKHALHRVNSRQNDRPDDQQPQILIGDVIVHDIPRDHGIKQIADGNRKRTDQIYDKQPPMRPIIGKESPDQLHNQLCLLLYKNSDPNGAASRRSPFKTRRVFKGNSWAKHL